MDLPFLLVSAVPRKEIPVTGILSDAGITDSTILFVEENQDRGYDVTQVACINVHLYHIENQYCFFASHL